ncbi:transcription termination/antitermination NusG family protein [Oceanobacillus damuensis]|uniref:transcription termination/antitermination NusG family protein n=1 Tax=Oceanobacillus damuensis TaxID=937928 RepID=UPI000830BEBD|nr:transcription termination/antitermination NusG family protein [Oceanobacillus damuensis]
MSFFAVQVRTGSEIAVKTMLNDRLIQSGMDAVTSIFALETYTQIANSKNDQLDVSRLTGSDISNHLYIQRLQTNLSNLRIAYQQMQCHEDVNTLDLMEEYRKQIKNITTKLKQIRDNSKKIESVLKGYILIELHNNFSHIPAHLWHLVKSIPKVIGFPSKMNIPQHEIEAFFEEVDMSHEVELQFNEILSYEDQVKAQNELLHEANQVKNPQLNKTLLESMDEIDTDVVAEIDTLKKQNPDTMLERIKAFIKNKRETVSMPFILFYQIFDEERSNRILPDKLNSFPAFLQRLRKWLQANDVMLE